MSLQYLGAHFPVLHRQLTSPTSKTFREISPHEDLTQDSKEVLVDRLNDLILQLSNTNTLEDSAVSTIHSQVDKIEQLIRSQNGHIPNQSPRYLESMREDDTFWGPATPTQNLKMRLPMSPRSDHSFFLQEPHMSTSKAEEVAKAAEDLACKMTITVTEMQKRKEESDVSRRKHSSHYLD
jgi:hypothetical protein